MSDLHCPARILLARHGEAEYESATLDRSGGTLTTTGRAQARGLGERLRGERVAGVVCSEVSRAVQTAEVAAGVLGLPVAVRVGLQEFAAGDRLGHPRAEAGFDPVLEAWVAGDLAVGVPGGETGADVADRAFAVLDEVADRFRGESVLVVTHGGVVRAVRARLVPGVPPGPGGPHDVPNCATWLLERDADGWRVG